MNMTKPEINVACAKALGWKLVPRLFHNEQWKNVPTWLEPWEAEKPESYCSAGKMIGAMPPNFCGSHDACQQLRDALTEEQRISFVTFLITSGSSHHEAYWRISNATPEQICKAFLSAKGIE